ncbi:hypothetical protein [Legionella erythra]|uniref:Uncharacterized protein n=1 Tax=Legionella erythra TaxID=448 RepID=A0A0W0TKM0_LEGER|nr:hypothetical protein [Legionella erythra]KTC96148.1 hypothetical protein Lery_1940 [Legionella erythra]
MKIVEVYLSTSWLYENTQRQRFRDRQVEDLVSASHKLLKAAPMVALAGAGFSKGMVNPSLTLMNISTHTVKEIHNGVTNVGKNNGRFYEGIDRTKQPQMKKNAQGNFAGPLVKLWLVTDDDEAKKTIMRKGVLFHSQTEAMRFKAMYTNLDAYLSSKFYHQKEFVTLRINDSDLPLFKKELLHYLKARENSLRSEILVRPKLSPQNFALSRVYEEETGTLVKGQDGKYLVEIDFPVAVGSQTLAKYFPETIDASVRTESFFFSEALSELEQINESDDEFDLSEGGVVSEFGSTSQQGLDSEDELDLSEGGAFSQFGSTSQQSHDSDDGEFEGPPTIKGKERERRYRNREDETLSPADEINALNESVRPQASDEVSARHLSGSGLFKHSGNADQSEADSELNPPGSRPK